MPIESSVVSQLGALQDNEPDEPDQDLDDDEGPAPRPSSSSAKDFLVEQIGDANLARYLTREQLDTIGIECVREYRFDETSRNDWCDKSEKAMRFATQEAQPKSFPWPGASSMIFPMITQAVYDFGARTYPAIVQGRNVARGVVWGSDRGTPVTEDGEPEGPPKTMPGPDGQPQPIWLVAPGAKRKLADKIGEHMSWQLLTEMPEWEPQTDTYLHQMAAIGGFVRKSFRDPVANRNKSLAVSLLNLVWNYHAPSFEAAPRHSELCLLYPHEIVEMERAELDPESGEGMFLHQDYGPGGASGEGEKFNGRPLSQGDQDDPDAPQLFIEQHCRLDLDDDGYSEPYVVTVHLRSFKVVRIVARYAEDGIEASEDGDTVLKVDSEDHYTLYPFLPSIDGGSYPTGFGHLLHPLNHAVNTTLNQLFDAGTLANAGGGFISDQLGLPSGQTLFQVGKYVRVTTKGMAIRDAVLPLPFAGPNVVLFQILGFVVEAAKQVAGIGNILAGDAAIANAPPTTVLALIEQGLTLYTSIIKRVFRAEKAELAKLHRLNRRFIDKPTEYEVGDEWKEITPDDYRQSGGVEPVADPTMVTDMQKLIRSQVVMSVADNELNAQFINRREAVRRTLEDASIPRIDDLMTPENPQAAQAAAAAQALQMQMAQAQLGAEHAKASKDWSQAMLNMALTRKNATAAEEAALSAQLEFAQLQLDQVKMQIESANTMVKAAAVDHKFHDTRVSAITAAAQRAHEAALAAAQAKADGAPAPGLPVPGPNGPFPTPPSAPSGPDIVSPSSMGTGNTNVPGPDLAGAPSLPGGIGG